MTEPARSTVVIKRLHRQYHGKGTGMGKHQGARLALRRARVTTARLARNVENQTPYRGSGADFARRPWFRPGHGRLDPKK